MLRPLWQRYFAVIAYLLVVALILQGSGLLLAALKILPATESAQGQPFKLLVYSVALQIFCFLLPAPFLLRYVQSGHYTFSQVRLREILMCIGLIFLSLVFFTALYQRLGIEPKQLALIDGADIKKHEKEFLFLVSAAVPLYEEWVFRGLIFGILLAGAPDKKRVLAAVIFCALLFSGIHYEGRHSLSALPPIFVMALIFQYMTWRTGSIWPAVFGHAFQNLLSSAAFLSRAGN